MASGDPIDAEILRLERHAREMITEYVALKGKIKIGESYNTMYGDIFDFVNFRVETADSCLRLISDKRVADALGLTRSLLENYLLLILMCRGKKFFQLQNLERLTPDEFKKYIENQVKKLEDQHSNGEALACLEVRSYPRAARHAMYVFEGLSDKDIPGFFIPIHYFEFQNFRPEKMRLKDEDYFVYHEPTAKLKQALKEHRKEATHLYRHYLSYDGLVQCLDLNGFLKQGALPRLDAHYTFLGEFLHPTYGAARQLHERGNVYSGETAIGMGQTYSKPSIVLALLYVSYCLSGIFGEVATLLEGAPDTYITDPGTASLRRVCDEVPTKFSYFWFLFNEAPLYDKYQYAIHHVSDKDLATYGHFSGVPSERVPFNHNIYGQLQGALSGWENKRCGVYKSPLSSELGE